MPLSLCILYLSAPDHHAYMSLLDIVLQNHVSWSLLWLKQSPLFWEGFAQFWIVPRGIFAHSAKRTFASLGTDASLQSMF